MNIVNISDGLGNQMFKYAFAYALSRKKGIEVKLDISEFEGSFRPYVLDQLSISLETVSQTEISQIKQNFNNPNNSLQSYKHYMEPHFNYDHNAFELEGKIYYRGYWQTEKYFKEYRNELLEAFQPKEINASSVTYKNRIISSNSVSLHVRRGDYVSQIVNYKKHGICSIEYYKNAVSHISDNENSYHFFIFSDDLDWSKENFNFIENKTFVELPHDTPDYIEIHLMSLCKHNIIANSSFSWWGAWLNNNPGKKVIAPKNWFKDNSLNIIDLIPKEWITLFSAEENEGLHQKLDFSSLSLSFKSSS